jgi:putative membrane protein
MRWWHAGAATGAAKSSDALAQDRTAMAATRTLLAADRTLMAWGRTALSMLSFGFTIYKVLQGFEQSGGALPGATSPRAVGLFLTGMGTVAMVMGTIEYLVTVRELHAFKDFRLARPSLMMALVMSGTGLVLFFSIITRLF